MKTELAPTIVDADEFVIAFSTKDDGNMLRTNEHRIAVHRNRTQFVMKQGISPNDVFTVRTSHSANIDLLDRFSGGWLRRTFVQRPLIDTDFEHYYTGSDGILTLHPQTAIGLISGDCVPLVVWDNKSGLHGILHIGLLGALNGIVRKLPDVLDSAKVSLADVNFYLGPSILQRNYDVSNSGLWTAIAEQAHARVDGVERYLVHDNGKDYFDVPGMIVDQLQEIGAAGDRIQRYGFCVADPDSMYYSHLVLKQRGEYGNFYSVIALKQA
jgi:copper oxidase (laccase) domain-containing protein